MQHSGWSAAKATIPGRFNWQWGLRT